jgi:predicted transcriptional regulator
LERHTRPPGDAVNSSDGTDLLGALGVHGLPAAAALDHVHAVFARWLGPDYDLDALDAVLATAAVEQLDGDPIWLLVVSGPGNAKTETVAALDGAGAHLTSTITSEGALLSATPSKDKSKAATGGLLRKLGSSGVIVIKDVTSILSMNRDARAAVLAALREVYDGRWERNVGTDGGRTLTWQGRITVIGAVTTAYDSAHSVISAMGDRFALVRVDSHLGRMTSGRQALANVGLETTMRPELARAAGELLANLDQSRVRLTDQIQAELLTAADLVTLARTAVERDYRGQVVEAHAPEMPTRFAKMLGQLVRGGLAIGMDEDHALAVALRVARDSMPPLRLLALLDVADHPYARLSEVTKRLQRPRSTVDRVLQELHLLELFEIDQIEDGTSGTGWQYLLSPSVSTEALDLLRPVTRFVTTRTQALKEGVQSPTDISGYDTAGAAPGRAPTSAPTAVRR